MTRRPSPVVAGWIVVVALTCGSAAFAQPLVTGDLTLYYDFDESVGDQILDESGNGFDGTIVEGGANALVIDTVDPLRGPGAGVFQQSTNPLDDPVFVDVGGENITENFPEELPTDAITMAAWLRLTANMSNDQSVFQARSQDGSFSVLFQVQGDGRLRMTLREQQNNLTVVNVRRYTDGSDDNTAAVFPVGEWFHYAGTYDAGANLWALYFDGAMIASGSGTGHPIGDWGGVPSNFFAAGVGAIYDSNLRNLDGAVDELYVFHRALSAQEIETLHVPEPGSTWLAVWALGSLWAVRRSIGPGTGPMSIPLRSRRRGHLPARP